MITKTRAVGGGPIVFLLVHLIGIIGPFFVGWNWRVIAACVFSYYLRMFFVTGFMHRYFSHRVFKLLGSERWKTFATYAMGTACMTTCQKSFLWWAYTHRHHHEYSDTPEDIHSRRGFENFWKGLWWQHVGWILSQKHDKYDPNGLSDLLNPYPGLKWFDTVWGMIIPPVVYATTIFFVGFAMGSGIQMLIWGFFTSTVLLYHGTFCINSMAHLLGRQRYTDTNDDSRNSFILAIITMGEGWHNNHHKNMHRMAQAERWYEKIFDWTYLILKFAEFYGLIKCR
jgi:stearoyl-CoA desaturase (delta-9 desaturase)